jgi:hypothetical protein
MTASRTDIGILLGENKAEPLSGEGGLFLTLNLDRNGLANEQLAGAFSSIPIQG